MHSQIKLDKLSGAQQCGTSRVIIRPSSVQRCSNVLQIVVQDSKVCLTCYSMFLDGQSNMQASESQRAVGNLSAAYPESRKVKIGHDEVGLSKGESMQPINFLATCQVLLRNPFTHQISQAGRHRQSLPLSQHREHTTHQHPANVLLVMLVVACVADSC